MFDSIISSFCIALVASLIISVFSYAFSLSDQEIINRINGYPDKQICVSSKVGLDEIKKCYELKEFK